MAEAKRVRVMRNPAWRIGRDDGHPWFVLCDFCAGESMAGFFGGLMALAWGGPGRLGWAPTWTTAQEYAQRHAAAHEATRCTHCLHVPTEPLVDAGSRA